MSDNKKAAHITGLYTIAAAIIGAVLTIYLTKYHDFDISINQDENTENRIDREESVELTSSTKIIDTTKKSNSEPFNSKFQSPVKVEKSERKSETKTYPTPTFGYITAFNGKKYKTVKLLDKTWLAENLNEDVGNAICYDNSSGNCEKYGKLYNWEEAKNACSVLGGNWRIPTQQEWKNLATYYGGKIEDGALDDPTGEVYDAFVVGGASGLNLKLGGRTFDTDKDFRYKEEAGMYWTGSTKSDGNGWFYTINYHHPDYQKKGKKGDVYRASDFKKSRFSCRCVQ